MNTETAKEVFPTFEHWSSFNELAAQRDALYYAWIEPATRLIRQHFLENPAVGWSCTPWGAPQLDTKWYLDEFGPESLCITFAWCYELQLRLLDQVTFDSEAITKALETSEFSKLKQAFDRIDRYMQADSKLMESRNYEFGIPSDRNLSNWDLVWCAAFKQKEFTEQAIKKIERFVRDSEVTEQIRALNEIGRKAREQTAPTV